jgi:hypothetical protein
MIYSQTKNLDLGKGLPMKNVDILYDHLVYFTTIWYILWLFGIFYGYLVYFMVIWYILWLFGIFYGYLVYFMVIWYLFRSGMLYPKNLATLHYLHSGSPFAFRISSGFFASAVTKGFRDSTGGWKAGAGADFMKPNLVKLEL